MKKTISIIMPVYNAEEYLDESIGSVLDQTYKNFRLICVDDGSTDRSWDLLQKYEKADNRIKVFQQENKGQTLARLLGVKNSGSEWIAFIDADDVWDACFLEKHIEEAQHTSADIVISGAYWEKGTTVVEKKNKIKAGFYSTEEEIKYIHSKMLHFEGFFVWGILPYMWNKIFKRDLLIKSLERVDPKIRDGEDVVAIMNYLAVARRIAVLDGAYYHYKIRSSSKTEHKEKYYYENVSYLYLNLKREMERLGIITEMQPQIDQYMRYMVWMKEPSKFPVGKEESFLFPFGKVDQNSRVALYGAGKAGKAFYRQLKCTKFAKVVMWFDRNYKEIGEIDGLPISSPADVKNNLADYFVITIKNRMVAEEAKKGLINLGIENGKIIYGE